MISCFLADDVTVDWYRELIEIAKHFKNASEADAELYFLGDESKDEAEMLATKSDVQVTHLDSDARGNLEVKYVRPIMLRAKPLTALDLCFSGEHEEAAVITLNKRLSFHPTNGPGVMYYEATTTSLAKRNGGATIGFSLETPYAMPGASWYTFGYSIDSGIVRNGIGISPVKNITNGHKKPKVGDVWGVGYQVHFFEREFVRDGTFPAFAQGEAFYDDNIELRGPDYPYRTSFFVTCNGVLKFHLYVNATPLTMQPVLMVANSKDSLILNLSGDEAHPFRFNLKELETLERPTLLTGRGAHQIMFKNGAIPLVAGAVARLPPPISPKYIPISRKTLQLSDDELAAYGSERFATINGSYRKLGSPDSICAKRLPFSISQDIVELDISNYYVNLCNELTPEEACNIILHMNPKMTEEQQNAVLAEPNPRDKLQQNAVDQMAQRSMSLLFEYESYIRNFANLKRLLDRDGNIPVPAPGSYEWTTSLFHSDHPFPISMSAHKAIRIARVLSDAIMHQIGGIMVAPHAYFEGITRMNLITTVTSAAEEVAWAEAQLRRLILNVPTTASPRVLFDSRPIITQAASYADLFDVITVLRASKAIVLESLELSPSSSSASPSGVPIPQFTFPGHDTIATWASGPPATWLELLLWNAFLALPVVPDLEFDAAKPILPETLPEAIQAVMVMIGKERKRLHRASHASAAVNRVVAPIARNPSNSAPTSSSTNRAAGSSPSSSPFVSASPTGVSITPTSLIVAKPLDKVNETYLKLHVATFNSIIRQCDEGVLISTKGLLTINTETQVNVIRPLPLPTDPPVPATLELRRHGYFYACDQIHQLHFLIGPHPLLMPLIEWRLSTGLQKIADMDEAIASERHTRQLEIDRQIRASPDFVQPFNQPRDIVYPVSPNFGSRDPSTSAGRKSATTRVRPAVLVTFGIVLCSLMGVAGYLGYKASRQANKGSSRK